MEKFGKGQPVTRREDTRFLTGQGRYIGETAPREALVAHVLRSPVAHAEITALDVAAARAAPGVHLVLTAADLAAAGITRGMRGVRLKNRDGSEAAGPKRPLLAEDRLRYVGEPVALIVAETEMQARDAAELIELEYDDLPVSLTPGPGGTPIHPEAPGNRAFDWALGDEAATGAAFAEATRVVTLEVPDNRIIAASMEPRGAWAEWQDGRLHVSLSGQNVWVQKDQLREMFDLDPEAVRVTIPDVGGGFGMKALAYPEYFLVAQAARVSGRPVRWISDRSEAMLSDNGGRDLVSTAELAFDAEHRITGYRVTSRVNLGAYNSQFGQAIQTNLFSRVLTGVYDIPHAHLAVQGFYTNTNPVDAYRGAGRPEAIYVLERVMDRAARELGLDPWELRRINMIRPGQMPYATPSGENYDTGDFPGLLDAAARRADRDGFAARRASDERRGLIRGLGLAYYIESILGDPSEGARVVFEEDGTVTLYVGTQSNGQEHETVFAQFLADRTGLPVERIRVVQGDSDRIARGGGTGGSRSVTTQGTATLAVVERMVAAFAPFLAEDMGVAPEDVAFDGTSFRAPGSNLTPTLAEAAEMARAAGRNELLDHAARAKLPGRSFPNGAHVAEVVIDPETGTVRVDRYTAVDDFGNLINPLLAEGQVHGGVVQGIGQAIREHVVHDEDGQLLTASFMDYALPRADDLPMFGFASRPVPSTANPLGMKGCGEAGTVGALAAVANAAQDALWAHGTRQVDMPFTPQRTWELIQDGMARAG